jgi:hypothetical protein
MSGERGSHAAATLPVVLLAMAVAHGQVRDRPAPLAGTATVRGRVVLDEDGTPIRHATVMVSTPAMALARGLSMPGRGTAVTDDDGSFVVTGLPAGSVVMLASKAGYVSGAYRATRPGRPGVAASLDPGGTLDVVLRLGRGAVLAGSVRDPAGTPIQGVRILAIRTSARAPEIRLQEVSSRLELVPTAPSQIAEVLTDDRGEFRMYGLSAGDYYVAAMPKGSSVTGGVGRRSSSDVDEILRQLRLRTPPARGEPAPPVDVPSTRAYSFAPIYYPGTPVRSESARVTLSTGEQRAGLDFVFSAVPMTTIEGALVTPGGAPPEAAQVSLVTEEGRLPFAGAAPTLAHAPGADGRFVYTNVPPGRVRIVVRAREYLFGAELVTAGAAPVIPVTVQLQPGARLRGRVLVDASGERERLDSSRIAVGLTPVDAPPSLGAVIGNAFVGQMKLSVNGDGTFEFQHLGSGRYRLSAAAASNKDSAWWLRTATLPGRGDVLDALDLALGDEVSDLVLTMTDRPSSLAGRLQTAAGQPAADYHIVVFPADASLWSRQSRHVRAARPDLNGVFQFDELAGGAYLIAALTDVEPEEWQRPEFLASLRPAADPVTVVDGRRTVQNLRIGAR